MDAGVFVCGTDTGVGKTRACAGLVRALVARGRTVAGLKPIVTGGMLAFGEECADEDEGWPHWFWEDPWVLEQAGGVQLSAEERCLYRLREACSQHFAAATEGRVIALDPLVVSVHGVAAAHKALVVVEGVGGFRVPLAPGLDTADLAVALGMPVILVVGLRLGCINHAVLTAEAIRRRGLCLAAWVANAGLDPDYRHGDETVETISEAIELPCVARMPALGAARVPAERSGFAGFRADIEQQIVRAAAALAPLAAAL